MMKKILLPALCAFVFSATAQSDTARYRMVSDSTGLMKAYYLTADTTRINNPSLLPAGTAIPLYNEQGRQVAQYVLDDKRRWQFVPNKKP